MYILLLFLTLFEAFKDLPGHLGFNLNIHKLRGDVSAVKHKNSPASQNLLSSKP